MLSGLKIENIVATYGINLTDSKPTVKCKYYALFKNTLLSRGLL